MPQIQEWYAQGLPKDSHSVQNAIVITQCEKWPLIIDPQEQATRYKAITYVYTYMYNVYRVIFTVVNFHETRKIRPNFWAYTFYVYLFY